MFFRTTALLVLLAVSARADVPPDRLAAILARALAYDRALKERAGESVDVAVVWKSDDTTAAPKAKAVATAWKALGDLKIAGLPLHVHEQAFVTADANAAAFKAANVDAVFVVGSFGADLPRLLASANAQHAVTMAGARAPVSEGVAIGVDAVGDKATIFVNVAGAKSSGANFAADLLRVATVIKPGEP